jgi:7-cyano-7-deazaguanine synthase in queuosine biosynthesis|tara:strand:- start:253 stop:933 length:681 start_codon:yes stop_codon:yes gene_type:complete
MKFHTGPEWDERVITLEPKRKIGVLLSSGVDSTVLFKMLWDNFPTIQIKIFNVQTSENPEKPKITEILKKLRIDLDLEIVGESRWNWPMKSHYPRLCLAFQEIRDNYDCEELYCGNILSPHPYFFPRFNETQKGIPKRVWLTKDKFLKNPFEHLEKYHIIDLARRNEFEWLLDYTISCNTHAEIPCKDCMGCRELEWGYEQLDNPVGVNLDDMTKDAVNKYGDIGW